MNRYRDYYKRGVGYLEDFKDNLSFFEPNHLAFLLQEGVKSLLKSVLSFYDVEFDTNIDSVEYLLDTLEDKTTIRLPSYMKEFLYELDNLYCEGGCSNSIGSVVLSSLINDKLEEITIVIDDLRSFVVEEIGEDNL